jgi:hypothetical protein
VTCISQDSEEPALVQAHGFIAEGRRGVMNDSSLPARGEQISLSGWCDRATASARNEQSAGA